jgi:hypothetical protein
VQVHPSNRRTAERGRLWLDRPLRLMRAISIRPFRRNL